MTTLRETFEELYRPQNLRSASKETIRLWYIALKMYDRYTGHPAKLDDLTNSKLCAFSTWRVDNGVTAATANRDLASLLALWRWLAKHSLINRWPEVPLEHEPQRVPIAWSREEFNQLIRTARSLKGWTGEIPSANWWTAALLVCFDSGERIGAVLKLRWSDVTLPWIVFRAETRKGRDQDSAVRIAQDTSDALQKLAKRTQQVFPWPHTLNYIWRRYGRILVQAGLPDDRNRKFHCIRRTVASHAEAAGGNATQLLRHASRRNTLAYLDPRIVRPQQAVDLLWRPA